MVGVRTVIVPCKEALFADARRSARHLIGGSRLSPPVEVAVPGESDRRSQERSEQWLMFSIRLYLIERTGRPFREVLLPLPLVHDELSEVVRTEFDLFIDGHRRHFQDSVVVVRVVLWFGEADVVLDPPAGFDVSGPVFKFS